MRDALDEQIEAYGRLLPAIREEYGSAWVLVADRKLVKTFNRLSDAVSYANDHYGEQLVLIRHTDERETESAPIVQVRSAN